MRKGNGERGKGEEKFFLLRCGTVGRGGGVKESERGCEDCFLGCLLLGDEWYLFRCVSYLYLTSYWTDSIDFP